MTDPSLRRCHIGVEENNEALLQTTRRGRWVLAFPDGGGSGRGTEIGTRDWDSGLDEGLGTGIAEPFMASRGGRLVRGRSLLRRELRR